MIFMEHTLSLYWGKLGFTVYQYPQTVLKSKAKMWAVNNHHNSYKSCKGFVIPLSFLYLIKFLYFDITRVPFINLFHPGNISFKATGKTSHNHDKHLDTVTIRISKYPP